MKVVSKVVTLCTLLLAQSCTSPDPGSSLRTAVVKGDLTAVSKFATSAGIANSANADGITALMIAATQGGAPIVSALLNAGADRVPPARLLDLN